MSANRLEKNYQRDKSTEENFLVTPFIIGDSKVKYLKPFSTNNKIVWICKSGATSSVIFTWIHRNLRKLVKKDI